MSELTPDDDHTDEEIEDAKSLALLLTEFVSRGNQMPFAFDEKWKRDALMLSEMSAKLSHPEQLSGDELYDVVDASMAPFGRWAERYPLPFLSKFDYPYETFSFDPFDGLNLPLDFPDNY